MLTANLKPTLTTGGSDFTKAQFLAAFQAKAVAYGLDPTTFTSEALIASGLGGGNVFQAGSKMRYEFVRPSAPVAGTNSTYTPAGSAENIEQTIDQLLLDVRAATAAEGGAVPDMGEAEDSQSMVASQFSTNGQGEAVFDGDPATIILTYSSSDSEGPGPTPV